MEMKYLTSPNNVLAEKIQRTYGDLNGQLHVVELQRDGATSLGLCLAGNRDLATMSIYVVGILPASAAAGNGCIHVGDELLEVGHSFYLCACLFVRLLMCVCDVIIIIIIYFENVSFLPQ